MNLYDEAAKLYPGANEREIEVLVWRASERTTTEARALEKLRDQAECWCRLLGVAK